MKAKIRATGEIVTIISYIAPNGAQRHHSDKVSYIDSTGEEQTNIPMNINWDIEEVIESTLITNIDWEQRRFELVKQFVNSHLIGSYLYKDAHIFIGNSIAIANEIINQLKQQSD